MQRLRDLTLGQLHASSPVERVLRGEDHYLLVDNYAEIADRERGVLAPERVDVARKLGLDSLAVVPLLARGGVLGCVAVATDGTRPRLGEPELALVRDLAARAGLMFENTQLYARERAAAATLQRSLLPRLPRVPGMEIAAAYVPAADEVAVGGDWYDVFELHDSSSIGIVLGDVMGHNIDSAARMGKLSTIVRAYAWPGSEPDQVLAAADRLLVGTGMNVLATCVYAQLVPTDAGATLRFVSAGHPPVVVRDADGTARPLGGGRRPMLGISQLCDAPGEPVGVASLDLATGSTLICFTDGLVDAFADEPDLDAGLAELCRLTSALPLDAGPQMIVDELTRHEGRHKDDVAVVAIHIG